MEWFGNLSSCQVRLEYKTGEEDTWHSLGEYGPGQHTELGGGTLLLPASSSLRVVEVKSGDMISNIGRLGKGLPPVYVDNTNCQAGSATTPSAEPPERTCPPPGHVTAGQWALAGVILGLLALTGGALIWLGARRKPTSALSVRR